VPALHKAGTGNAPAAATGSGYARRHPDMSFLVYHSGFDPGVHEWTYDPGARAGVDVLLRSVQEAGNPPNVFAGLGSTWRFVMRGPDQAAHLLGKLLKVFGEDRILWDTDSIWYGSPQDQIQAFRAFEISGELQERHGYPALTPAIKRKIFGLNAARVYGLQSEAMRRKLAGDPVQRRKTEYLNAPRPSFATYLATGRNSWPSRADQAICPEPWPRGRCRVHWNTRCRVDRVAALCARQCASRPACGRAR
jgi:hypothetical protein